MKRVFQFSLLMFVVLGIGGSALAYEGGTKMIATMTHPDEGKTDFFPLFLVPSHELTPSKAVLEFLPRIPQPTLLLERIRAERPGPSLGTKLVARFQRERSAT